MSGGRLLLFGGTTEARELLERGLPAIYCAATDYGADLVRGLPNVEARPGRLDAEGIAALIRDEGVPCVIDATHPYAREVTANVRAACERTGTPLLRVLRASGVPSGAEGVTRVPSCAAAAELLNAREGAVLLTVGSRELSAFASVRDGGRRLFARVLPAEESLRACAAIGLDPAHVLAMQGPFSLEMNLAMLRDVGAAALVTKDGGPAGGMEAKLTAARRLGVEVILVERPADGGVSVEEALLWARRMLGLSRPPLFPVMRDIEGRLVLVVGGGAVARRRAETLLRCGARVRAVSPRFCADFPEVAERLQRAFAPEDLDGALLAVAASGSRTTNREASRRARERGIPVSVADNAAEGDFFFPSLVASGAAAASVSSAGLSCSLTRRLSDRLRAVWEGWVAEERATLQQEKGGTEGCD